MHFVSPSRLFFGTAPHTLDSNTPHASASHLTTFRGHSPQTPPTFPSAVPNTPFFITSHSLTLPQEPIAPPLHLFHEPVDTFVDASMTFLLIPFLCTKHTNHSHTFETPHTNHSQIVETSPTHTNAPTTPLSHSFYVPPVLLFCIITLPNHGFF